MNIYRDLDQNIREVSMTDEEYEKNKALVNNHLNGDLAAQDLPEILKQALFDWEIQKIQNRAEYDNWGDEIEPWEDYD